ncbi:Di-sulfide bridge nucleocytoplasmic transport domain-containing protein [Lipomyces oligophaga]|uniref:Di-sulfide bridge nucleocytoplasmic transport domain-containing protein n=1 Tax=Lipomyces oligophaga TaxID=45792 RepID=UPI0034CDE5D4
MMEMDYTTTDSSRYRGHESPMDFSYFSSGPAIQGASPFTNNQYLRPLSTVQTPGAFNGSQSPQRSERTPFFTPSHTQATAQFGSSIRTNLGRGKADLSSSYSTADEDVVMLSSSPYGSSKLDPTPTKSTKKDNEIQDEAPSPEIMRPEGSVSRKFLKSLRRTDSNDSSPISKLLSPLFSRRKASSRTCKSAKYAENSDLEDDDGDVDSEADDSDWIGNIIVKKTTVLRSPRKISASSRSARMISRTTSNPTVGSDLQQSQAPSLLATLSRHDNLPYIFAQYLQLIFNIFLVLIVFYMIMSFVLMVRSEVAQKVEEYTQKAVIEISQCSKDYLSNHCTPDRRAPYMEALCATWQKCMSRDPNDVGRASVSAETVADILNSFIERISYKSMGFILVLILGSMYISSGNAVPGRQNSSSVPSGQERNYAHHSDVHADPPDSSKLLTH